MMTVNQLCKCFKYFNNESRVVIRFEHGDSITCKWKEACCICRYTVKRFKVTSLIANNIIILEIWV